MSERKRREKSRNAAPPSLLPAKLLPKPAPAPYAFDYSKDGPHIWDLASEIGLPSRSLKEQAWREASAPKTQWRRIQPKLSANVRLDSFAGAYTEGRYLDLTPTGKLQVWEVNEISARRSLAPKRAHLRPHPSSERGQGLSPPDDAGHNDQVSGLVHIQTTCALCNIDVTFLVNDETKARTAYFCFPCHYRQERLARARQNHVAKFGRTQIPAQPPVSPDLTLSMKFARAVEAIGSHHSWITLGPSRCGNSRVFDAAAHALYQAAMYRAQRDVGQISDRAQSLAVVHYGKAAQLLVKSVDSTDARLSDETLATVTMFYTFEILVPSPHNDRNIFHHLSAIKTILLNRQNLGPPTELTRALVYTVFGWLFYAIAAMGFNGPSPFETDYFLNMEPFSLDCPPAGLVTLRKLTLQLYIKLPRLIAHVRRLRVGEETDVRTVVDVATDLLHLNCRSAENQIVRLLTITRTRDETGIRNVVPYSYDFKKMHWQAIVNYWHCRLMVLRLCLVTNSLASTILDLQWLDRQQRALLVREQDRISESVLMSWQFASDSGYTAKAQMLGSINEIWGALASREMTSRGHSATMLRTFILEQRRKLGLGSVGARGAKEMDGALAVFGGFPDGAHVGHVGSASPPSEVWDMGDDDVFSDGVEMDWFGFGKDEVKQRLDQPPS